MTNKKLPPIAGDKSPILNHLLKFKASPYEFIKKHRDNLGGIFSFKLFNRIFYVLSDPEHIKHVLVSNSKNYSRKKSYEFLEEMLGKGLLTTVGEEWKKRRRIAQPAFYKEQLKGIVQEMERSIKQCMNEWDSSTTVNKDLYHEMNEIALTVLCNSIIKTDVVEKLPVIKQSLLDSLHYLSKKRFKAFKFLHRLPSKTKTVGQKGIKTLKEIVLKIIEDRRESGSQQDDLLAMLMASTDEETSSSLTNEELLDEVMTIFIAGHDTTAVVLTWATYLIGTHPEVEQKIREEINQYMKGDEVDLNDLRNFTYTKMVVQEVLRLYPPVWTFGRKAINDDDINGFHVPANTSCTMPAILTHRSKEHWEKPDEFYPEHFLPEATKKRTKYAYFPFGGGQHLCIGEHFAMIEIQLAIIHILKKFNVKISTQEPVEMEMLITLKPKNKINVQFEKRIN
ncbi:MAG: cytochrome P450 [Saprospiraceae bacterium]|jgi:cytochrome P450